MTSLMKLLVMGLLNPATDFKMIARSLLQMGNGLLYTFTYAFDLIYIQFSSHSSNIFMATPPAPYPPGYIDEYNMPPEIIEMLKRIAEPDFKPPTSGVDVLTYQKSYIYKVGYDEHLPQHLPKSIVLK